MLGSKGGVAVSRLSAFNCLWVVAVTGVIISQVRAQIPPTCPASLDCECTINGIALSAWRNTECNQCVLLQEEQQQCARDNTIGGTETTLEAWDQNTHQFGIMFTRDSRILLNESSVAVVKIKNSVSSDVKFPGLTIRGFNTPTCDGCIRPNGTVVWTWQRQSETDEFYSKVDSVCTISNECMSSHSKLWFFNINVWASQEELQLQSLVLNFEVMVGTILYVTRGTDILKNTTQGLENNLFISRGHDQIDYIGKYPREYTLAEKLFEIDCYSLHNTLACPFEGDVPGIIDRNATYADARYTIRPVKGRKLYVYVPVNCTAAIVTTTSVYEVPGYSNNVFTRYLLRDTGKLDLVFVADACRRRIVMARTTQTSLTKQYKFSFSGSVMQEQLDAVKALFVKDSSDIVLVNSTVDQNASSIVLTVEFPVTNTPASTAQVEGAFVGASDAVVQIVTQTVKLLINTWNYISFYVFKDTNIEDLMTIEGTMNGWMQGDIFVRKLVNSVDLSYERIANNAWILNQAGQFKHEKLSTYSIFPKFVDGRQPILLKLSGVAIVSVEFDLLPGPNHLPTLNWNTLASQTWQQILPFSVAEAGSMLRYDEKDELFFGLQDADVVAVSSSGLSFDAASGLLKWNENKAPVASTVAMLILSNREEVRDPSTSMTVRIGNRQDYGDNWMKSYQPASATRRRLLQVTQETYVNIPGVSCYGRNGCFCTLCNPSSTDQCATDITNVLKIPWPTAECNKCVILNRATDECPINDNDPNSGIGREYIQPSLNFAFYVQGTTRFSAAVAKLKNKVVVIRGYGVPSCYGCFDSMNDRNYKTTAVKWEDSIPGTCSGCDEERRVYFFSFAVAASNVEIASYSKDVSPTALMLDFEFALDRTVHVVSVTTSQEELRYGDGTRIINRPLPENNYWVPSYHADIKQLQSACVQDTLQVLRDFRCPYEGNVTQTLVFKSSAVPGATHTQVQGVLYKTTMPSQSTPFKIVLRQFAGKTLYVTLDKAALGGGCVNSMNIYKSFVSDGVTYTCDTTIFEDDYNAIWPQITLKFKKLICASYTVLNMDDCLYMCTINNGYVASSERLNITMRNDDGRSPISIAFDNTAATATQLTKWTLDTPNAYLEIVFTKDDYTCEDSPTDISFLISTMADCGPGYTRGSTACVPCMDGTYKAGSGDQGCDSCAGTVDAAKTNCTACAPDSFKTQGQNNCTQCVNRTVVNTLKDGCIEYTCAAGSGGDPCVQCTSGYYKVSTGAGACTACSVHSNTKFTSSVGSTAATSCTCPTGSGGSDCLQCTPGYYKDSFGIGECMQCSNNVANKFTSIVGSTASTSCTCPPGSGGSDCLQCTSGFYKASTGVGACTACSSVSNNKFISLNGSTADTSCICPAGSGDQGCLQCVSGSYKILTGTGLCTRCSSNTATKFTSSVGSSAITNCTCPAGSGGQDCLQCTSGYYKDSVGIGACTRCSIDVATKFTSSLGSSASTNCTCPAGSGGQDCLQCTSGSYKNSMGRTACTPCSIDMATKFTSSLGSTASTNCTCPAGSGGPNCLQCLQNTYRADSAQALSCVACNTTSSSSLAGSTDCTCNGGYQGANGIYAPCSQCVLGKSRASGSTNGMCTLCPPGKYQDTVTALSCKTCTENSGHNVAGSSDATSCLCNVGFQSNGMNADTYQCSVCAQNHFKKTIGSAECTACPSNQRPFANSSSCYCMSGFSGDPCELIRIIKTFQLAMTSQQFVTIQANFTIAIASVFAVNISDIQIAVVASAARRRLLAEVAAPTVVQATIALGDKTSPTDTQIQDKMAALGFAVTVVPNVVLGTTVSSANGGVLSIFSMLGIFGDNVILQIAVISVCVICMGALLSCLQQISGAAICCSCHSSNCLKKIKLGCLYCRCFCSNKPLDNNSDDDTDVAHDVPDEQDDDDDTESSQNKTVDGSDMFIYHVRPYGYQNAHYC